MSKLMTSVAVLQCVEDGTLDLDKDARPLLPEMGIHGVIHGFDDDNNTAKLVPDSTPITLRMLLSHTSGHEYDWMSPFVAKWRASRNEEHFSGPTVAHKSSLPLVFPPGTSFSYGAGHDWAGKAVEVATNGSLEDFMRARIWDPLGIESDTSFWPKTKEGMKYRVADWCTLNENGEPPAVDLSSFDMLNGATDCLGGGGVYTSAKGYYTFLSALLRRDIRLLQPSSYTELFRPQLDEKCEQALNDYAVRSEMHDRFLGLGIPRSIRKTWSFAGVVVKEGQEGRCCQGTTFWAGVPSVEWFIDHEAGICGAAICQLLPPMLPSIINLHEQFQRSVFTEMRGK